MGNGGTRRLLRSACGLPRRMARTGRRPAAVAGSRVDAHAIRSDPSLPGRELALAAHTEGGERCLAAMTSADPGPTAVATVSLERRRLCGWLLVPAAQLVVPLAGVGQCRAYRLRAHVAGAGVHARRARSAGLRGASRVDAQGSAPRRARARRRSPHARARAASDARPGVRPLHRGDPLRDPGAGNAAHRVRPQGRDAHAALRAETRRRVRLPRGSRSLSADAPRSDDGAARGAARARGRRRQARRARRRSAHRRASPRRSPSRRRSAGGGSRLRSIPGTAARIPARSAGAAPTKRM